MAQVLKEEVYERIFNAGIDVFYEKGYRLAKTKEIAEKAEVAAGLLYSYFKNKEELFNKIASTIHIDFERIAAEEDEISGMPYEKYKNVTERYLYQLLEHHKILVIVFDKSEGTKYESTKKDMINALQMHIKESLSHYSDKTYDDIFTHMLATNFTESFLEVARHYTDISSAKRMLDLLTQCYYEGVNSL